MQALAEPVVLDATRVHRQAVGHVKGQFDCSGLTQNLVRVLGLGRPLDVTDLSIFLLSLALYTMLAVTSLLLHTATLLLHTETVSG